MAVPSSGPLELRGDINLEVNGNVTDTNVALHQLSLDAGFSAPDAMSDFYGYSSVVPPSVSTSAVTSISATAQTLNGNVSNTGGENVSRGFYHGTNSSSPASNTKYTLGGTQGTGTFACARTGLTSGTTYYNWAFACNSAGESVGSRCQANTGYPPFTPNPSCVSNVSYRHCVSFIQYRGASNSCTRHGICFGYINPYSGGSTNTSALFCACNTAASSPSGNLPQPSDQANYSYKCLRNYTSNKQCICSNVPNWQSDGEVYAGIYSLGMCFFANTPQNSNTNFAYTGNQQTTATFGQTSNYCILQPTRVVFGPQVAVGRLDTDTGQCLDPILTCGFDRADFDVPSDIRLKTNINYL